MAYNELEKGIAAPATLKRKNGARYQWKKDGKIYVQSGPDLSSDWIPEEPILFKVNEEVSTGELWHDGKEIFRKLLTGDSFATSGGYGYVPHGVDIDTLVAASGYVGTPGSAQYATYANYIDTTNFYWYWTSPGNYKYHFWITYTKS